MEIYAAPKLSKYMTALGAFNVKSFTYEINQHTHEHTHTHTHIHTHTCACMRADKHMHTQACSKKFVLRTKEKKTQKA